MCAASGRRAVGALSAIAYVAAAGVMTAQSGGRPVNERGPADAPVTVVELCSYGSEACSRLNIVVSGVVDEFGERVRLVFHHVAADDTPAGLLRYRAALSAGQQGQFWPMHDLLMANRQRATRADILAMAHQLGLDAERFRADLDSAETIAAAGAGQAEAAASPGGAAPALIVNGRTLAALSKASDLRAAITLALAPR
jgi:protein-disulfide isomerase